MTHTIIDRRKNPGGKSQGNRQKFIKRTREQIRKSIHDNLGDRSIGGSGDGQDVVIERKGINEPQFGHNPQTGERDIILPGNKEYSPGDRLKKPQGGAGKGPGEGDASNEGEGEDEFGFALTNDEFVNILFEDLELPHMISKENKAVERFEMSRAGYSNEGNPAQLNLEQSMVNSMGRRIALLKPKRKRMKEIEERLAELGKKKKLSDEEHEEYFTLEEELKSLRTRARAISFIDPVDLRYNNFTKKPVPVSQAVVFFVMDVSASMTQFHKDLAKQFFMLLNLFVSRKYKHVECVFIRHHITARECTEDEFFNLRENGGTVVSSAFEMAKDILKDRYSPNEWNIYFAQASDGDNWSDDNKKLQEMLSKDILPICQYFSYIQVGKKRGEDSYYFNGNLIAEYKQLEAEHKNIISKYIQNKEDIYPVFREIFKKKDSVEK